MQENPKGVDEVKKSGKRRLTAQSFHEKPSSCLLNLINDEKADNLEHSNSFIAKEVSNKNSLFGKFSRVLNLQVQSKTECNDIFMVIGISNEGLEHIDQDNLILSPKILYNYPQNCKEVEMS